MQKIYHFSDSEISYKEINHFKIKFYLTSVFSALILVTIFFVGFLIVNDSSAINSNVLELSIENSDLKNKISVAEIRLKKLFNNLEENSKENNILRLATDLEPVHYDIENFGTGGSEFDFSYSKLKTTDPELISLQKYIELFSENLEFQSNNVEKIENKIIENKNFFKSVPAARPVKSRIGDRFGNRFHPILKKYRMHNGLDFLANYNTPIIAPGDGVVITSKRFATLGKTVKIDHGFGYISVFGHLNKLMVKEGQIIKRGDIIGLSGNTGSYSTGPHLHFEIRKFGKAIDPLSIVAVDVPFRKEDVVH